MRVKNERIYLPDHSLRFLRFEVDAFRTERHRHPQMELTWIEHGAGVRFVGDSAAPFESGDMVLVGADLPHAWVSARPDAERASVASVLQFSHSLFEHEALPELTGLRPLALLSGRGLLITGDTHRAVAQRMKSMDETDALGRLAEFIYMLRELALRPSDLKPIASRSAPVGRHNGKTRRIDRVIQWIHTHLDGTLAVQEAAQVANVTPAAFSRFFRRETGKTYTDYVNNVRCAEACVLLRKSAEPIVTVASACGFTTSSHFNRQFMARMGLTPRQYRQRA